jgi:GT2 family glycosyltransferase
VACESDGDDSIAAGREPPHPTPGVVLSGIDVIVVTYQSASLVHGCLRAARGCAGVDRLVVVDNASRDGSATAARDAGADLVLENTVNEGFARAVNQGLRQCSAEYVLLLNPDAVLAPEALESLRATLDAHGEAVMAGPVLVLPTGETLTGARRFSTLANRLLWHLPLPRRPRWSTPEYEGIPDPAAVVPVDYLWGAALLCRRAFLQEIGGLDERFFLYSEDEDLGRQARRRGSASLLVAGAAARHEGGASTGDSSLAWARIEVATARLLAKWDGPAVAALFRAGIVAVVGIRAALLAAAGRRGEASVARRTAGLLLAPGALGEAGAREQRRERSGPPEDQPPGSPRTAPHPPR